MMADIAANEYLEYGNNLVQPGFIETVLVS